MKFLWVALFAAAALALAGNGIFASLADVETAGGNTFTAKALNLQVGAGDPCTTSIAVNKIGRDTLSIYSFSVQNTGTVTGKLTITMGNVANSENGVSELETAAGDNNLLSGELGANLQAAFWMDADLNGQWSTSDFYLKTDGTTRSYTSGDSTSLPAEAYYLLDNFCGVSWAFVQTPDGESTCGTFYSQLSLPAGASDIVQSDSCAFTITFTLTQKTGGYSAP